MDFYSILKACYRDGIAPFELYSQMCDLCKGNLKLHEKARVLYGLYKKRDIFKEISLCAEVEFSVGAQTCVYIKKCSNAERACLIEVARLLHSDWDLDVPAEESTSAPKVKAPVPKREKEGGVRIVPRFNTPANAPMQQNPAPQTPQAKKTPTNTPPRQCKAGKINVVKISSLISDLEVRTSAIATSFQVRVLQNGVWTERKTGIGRYSDMTYINLDSVVADRIECLIPQGKYSALWLDKVQGCLMVEDNADSFKKVRITHSVGKICCALSCPSIYLSGRVTEIDLKYNACHLGNVEVRNSLGNVRISLRNVGDISDKVYAVHGKTENRYTKAAQGHTTTLKVVAEYGDIWIT